jgi:hypothetical protein
MKSSLQLGKLLVTCIALSFKTQAQNVSLSVPSTVSHTVKLTLGSKILNGDVNLPATFNLQIKSSVDQTKVVLKNTEVPIDTLLLGNTAPKKPYKIVKNNVSGTGFTLQKNYELVIYKPDGSILKKYINKFSGTALVTAATNAPLLPPTPANDFTSPNSYTAGSIINDALILASKPDEITESAIRKNYDVDNDWKDNKFLTSASIITVKKENTEAIQQSGDFFSTLLHTVGNADVTNIADGFAKFIVKRVKLELSVTFFQKFKAELAKYPDLQTVFPHTISILNNIDQDIYNYSNYIENLREAFRSDLQIIDQNLPGIIDNHDAFFKKHFEVGLSLHTACYVAGSLRNEMHPGDILDGYPTNYFDGMPDGKKAVLIPIKGSIQFLQLMSYSLKETQNDDEKQNYWVGMDMIRKLVGDKNALKIYIGLLLQQAKHKYAKIQYSTSAADNVFDKLNDANVVQSFDKDYTAYKNYILNLGGKVTEITAMIQKSKQPASDSEKVELYAKYFTVSTQLLKYAVEIGNLPHLEDIKTLKTFTVESGKYFGIADETSDLAIAVNRKKYADIVNHVVTIYKTITEKATDVTSTVKMDNQKKRLIAQKVVDQIQTDPDVTLATLASSTTELQGLNKNTEDTIHGVFKITGLIAKYGALMSNMINAKNSDDVANAIENAALPTGSARVKRETISNVALNAYCGLFTGHEKITGVNDDQTFNAYGLAVPIGVSASLGTKAGFSHSLFISLVDLGAVAAFRFTDNTTAQVPSIQLKDIFSPGIFYSLGIPKSPLSVNLGVQAGPNLRKVTKDNNDYSGKTYVRYSLSVCVDIPVLNFYTKPR